MGVTQRYAEDRVNDRIGQTWMIGHPGKACVYLVVDKPTMSKLDEQTCDDVASHPAIMLDGLSRLRPGELGAIHESWSGTSLEDMEELGDRASIPVRRLA